MGLRGKKKRKEKRKKHFFLMKLACKIYRHFETLIHPYHKFGELVGTWKERKVVQHNHQIKIEE